MKRFFALVLSILAVVSTMLLGAGCSTNHTGTAKWVQNTDGKTHSLVCECGERLPVNKTYSDTKMLINYSNDGWLPTATSTAGKYIEAINAQLGTNFADFDEYFAEYGEFEVPHYYVDVDGVMTCICGHTK